MFSTSGTWTAPKLPLAGRVVAAWRVLCGKNEQSGRVTIEFCSGGGGGNYNAAGPTRSGHYLR